MKILYTTEAVVKGGRAGGGRTSDGRLVVELSVPGSATSGYTLENLQSPQSARLTGQPS